MLEKLFKKLKKDPQQNNPVQSARKKIIIQAVIAVQTVIIAVALIFGMSAAWYTNVLQTSGLQFEAEAWGFTGEIMIAEEPVLAKPGQTGVIGLSATNDSDDMIDIAVRVSKMQMANEMQQRLFFYVDTAMTRNEETLDRVYINSQDSYTYTILSHSELLLTEEQANDVLLKWQWVYDMEGYYFLGDVMTQTDPESGETSIVTHVEDYLRPVEYNLDNATFEKGLLSKVDDKTVEEFLAELSETDGYKNDIVPAEGLPGYYQVDVDETGYGIWVYLCNWAEIQQATTYDSQLGQAAADALENGTEAPQYIARLMVVGQTARSEYTDVVTQEQLAQQLNEGTMVRLQENIVLTEPLIVNSGENVVLDMNGYSLEAPENQSALELTDATKLIVLNGTLRGSDDTKNVVNVSGSMLTMSNVDFDGPMRYGIYIADETGKTDSCVRLFDCDIHASLGAVSIRGNGEKSEGTSQLIVERCTLSGEYIAILGNGTKTYWGTDIQIIDSTITGYYAAVYQPQADSMTRITNSTLTGGTGVVIKAGDMRITDSVIKGVFGTNDHLQEPAVNKSGFSDTGDALYVDCSYDRPINVWIEGDNTILQTATQLSFSIRVFIPEENTSKIAVSVTGGKFDASVAQYVETGYQYDEQTQTVVLMPAPEEENNGE